MSLSNEDQGSCGAFGFPDKPLYHKVNTNSLTRITRYKLEVEHKYVSIMVTNIYVHLGCQRISHNTSERTCHPENSTGQ